MVVLGELFIKFGLVSGMPICEAFAQIEHQPNIYDVVHVKYFDEVVLMLWLMFITEMWIIVNLSVL